MTNPHSFAAIVVSAFMSMLLTGTGGSARAEAILVGDQAASGLKPVLSGLLVRQTYPGISTEIPRVGGLVQSLGWSDLQLAQGGPITRNNKIDKTIAFAKANHLTFKLRVNAGIQAPTWAKALGGAPVAVRDNGRGINGTIGRFWTAAFGKAYDLLQAKLAALYDTVPQLAEVEITRCTTVYSEPFLRQVRDPVTVHNLLAAGYTVAADQACQQGEIDAHKAWSQTRSGLAFNPYEQIYPDGTSKNDIAYTEQIMRYCRQQLGRACVLENDSIRLPILPSHYAEMYAYIQALGPPISYETANPSRVGDPVKTITWAATVGANSVELPKVMPGITLSALLDAAAALKLNPTQ